MNILLDNEDITITYIPKLDLENPFMWGYYTKVKETGYWYRNEWRWGHVKRIGMASQVSLLNARLAQLVRAPG